MEIRLSVEPGGCPRKKCGWGNQLQVVEFGNFLGCHMVDSPPFPHFHKIGGRLVPSRRAVSAK